MAEKLVVAQSRVPSDVMAKIRATAASRGMSESEVMRAWLQQVADTVTPTSIAQQLVEDLATEKRRRQAIVDEQLNSIQNDPVHAI